MVSSRRHASSVPGPMESRRRLGKRRIAHLSEAGQAPLQDFGAFWNMNQAADRHQWQWEAPKAQKLPKVDISISGLPAWLIQYEPTSLGDVREEGEEESSLAWIQASQPAGIEEDLRKFREAMDTSSEGRIRALCDAFSRNFRHNLALGLVSEHSLIRYLGVFAGDVLKVMTDELHTALCISFYLATWQGLKACTAMQPLDLRGSTLNTFLLLLAQLPSNKVVQTLATDVFYAASLSQISEMEQGLSAIILAWLSSWTNLDFSSCTAKQEPASSQDPCQFVSSIQQLEQSVEALGKFLEWLPPNLAPSILHAATEHIISSCFANFVGPIRTLRTLRHHWLSVVANTPHTDENLLLEICSTMDVSPAKAQTSIRYAPSIPRLTLYECCDLLLEFWTSHGEIKGTDNERAAIKANFQKCRLSENAEFLLHIVTDNHELSWTRTRCLTRFLRRLEKWQVLYNTLKNLGNLQIKVPTKLYVMEIRKVCYRDVRCAINIYKLFHRTRQENMPLRFDGCTELIAAMIRSPDIDPAEIWGNLQIPLYDPHRMFLAGKVLSKTRVTLMHKMAMEFAQAECRSPRLALRNVTQCALHLQRHRAPLSADLTRALSHAGITRDLLRGRRIGRHKALWILDLVRKVEGDEVAGRLDRAVCKLQTTCIAEQQQLRRAGNPLRVGPID